MGIVNVFIDKLKFLVIITFVCFYFTERSLRSANMFYFMFFSVLGIFILV